MTAILQPVSGLLATVIDLAEQDPDAAGELIRLGLYEAMQDEIERVRPSLEQDAVALIEKQAAKARAHLLRTYVGKALDGEVPADATDTARGLAILDEYVSKAGLTGGTFSSFFNERSVHRDAQGQFAKPDEVGMGKSPKKGIIPTSVRHQTSGRRGMDRIKRALGTGILSDDDTVKLMFEQGDPDKPGTGTTFDVEVAAGQAMDKIIEYQGTDANNQENFLTAIALPVPDYRKKVPEGTQRAAYDAMSGFTDPALAQRVATQPYLQPGKMGAANVAENWNNPSGEGGDRRSYRRLAMTGQALQAVSDKDSTGAMVGGLAQLVGELGPEAEEVLSPGFTRIAYRYRGTERRPDAAITSELKEANQRLAVLDPDLPANASQGRKDEAAQVSENYRERVVERFATGSVADRAIQGKRTARLKHPDPDKDKVLGVVGYYAQKGPFHSLTPDQRAMRVRGDLVAAELVDSVPNAKLAALSINAGQTPPSVGVMIDADGDVVTQAQGFNGDHYLPFDLKNLKGMQGGQYIRTRATGGPTTEDIYTGLLAGVRQMQVVSNSGVFTVEFDPDLRGGRRYTDKAKKMIDRYGHLLDTVGAKDEAGGAKFYRQDVSGERKAELYQAAMSAVGWNKSAVKATFTDMLNNERLQQSGGMETGQLTGDETIRARIDREVATEVAESGGDQMTVQQRARLTDDLRRKKTADQKESGVQPYQLNGDGYHDALLALQTEFPYYIRSVKHEELPEFYDKRNLGPSPRGMSSASDTGYTPPGQNRSASEQRGYHGTVVRGKHKAGGNTGQLEAEVPTEDGAGGTGATGSAGGTAPSARNNAAGSAQIGGVRFSIDKDTERFDKIIGEDSATVIALAAELGPFMTGFEKMDGGVWNNWSVVDGETEDKKATNLPPAFLTHKWQSFPEASRPRDFAKWLLNDANDVQRAAVQKAVNGVEMHARTVTNPIDQENVWTLMGGKDTGIARAKKIAKLTDFANPFAPPAGTEAQMYLASPKTGKPQPIPGVVAAGATLKNYESFEHSAGVTKDPASIKLLSFIKAYDGKSNTDIAGDVQGKIDELKLLQSGPNARSLSDQDKRGKELDITNANVAWAFVRGKEMAALHQAANPKAKAGVPASKLTPLAPHTPLQAGKWGTPVVTGKSDSPPADLSVGDLAATYSRAEILAWLTQG